MKRRILPLLLVVFLLITYLGTALADDDYEFGIKVSPDVIVMFAQSQWLTVHADFPYASVGSKADVTLRIQGANVDNTVGADKIKSDLQGNLVAKFKRNNIDPYLEHGEMTFTLTVSTVEKENAFTGWDTARVITCQGKGLEASIPMGKRVDGRSSLFSKLCGP
jgi:hypothetical protein